MRSSSVRALTLVLTSLALTPALCVGLGCGPTEQPGPKKVERASPFERGAPQRQRDPNSPLRDPEIEVPAGRDGPQQTDEEIDATLAKAAEYAELRDIAQQRNILRHCANKTPGSARCDGAMGLSLITTKNRKATAIYYLREAANLDDPKADAALYAAIAEALRANGVFDGASTAMERAIARDASPENLFAFGQLLSTMPDRLVDAADRVAEARAGDDQIQWLYEEAIIRGQIGIREQAQKSAALFTDLVARIEAAESNPLPIEIPALRARIAELEKVAKDYPTAAEAAANQTATPSPNPAAPAGAPTGAPAGTPAGPATLQPT